VESAEVFAVALELDPASGNGVVRELAAMAGHRRELTGAVDGEHDVDLGVVAADERSAVLLPEHGRDVVGDGPAEDRDAELPSRNDRSVGRALVVGVAGDPAVVEGQQRVRVVGDSEDVGGEPIERDRAERSVGMVVDRDLADAEHAGGTVELGGATLSEVG
jgi:hypothetical protein